MMTCGACNRDFGGVGAGRSYECPHCGYNNYYKSDNPRPIRRWRDEDEAVETAIASGLTDAELGAYGEIV